MGGVVFRQQSIKQAVEFASSSETDVTDANMRVLSWIWVPQGAAKKRIRFSEFFAICIIMVYRWLDHRVLEGVCVSRCVSAKSLISERRQSLQQGCRRIFLVLTIHTVHQYYQSSEQPTSVTGFICAPSQAVVKVKRTSMLMRSSSDETILGFLYT